MKVICPVCERVVGAYIPRGGDGSAFRPRRHGDCDGRFDLVLELVDEGDTTKLEREIEQRPYNQNFHEWARRR